MSIDRDLTLYEIANKERRYWQFYREQMHRGKDTLECRRIAHAKLAPELAGLSEKNKQRILTAIELSE